jgi:hypothetical protein
LIAFDRPISGDVVCVEDVYESIEREKKWDSFEIGPPE